MDIRNAKISDAGAIHSLISYYAELDRMLFCSLADIYEKLQIFKVAEGPDGIVGCCALQVVWSDLAEIKSLAVDHGVAGRGVGSGLVEAALADARRIGVRKVFTLTLEAGFFEKRGFARGDKACLPMKVWSDCARCSKQDKCDEVAMIYDVSK
jgi:amino-acid N-acetyltransferase